MKQIDECLTRALTGKRPLRKKWGAIIHSTETHNYLFLYHYHHEVLVYNLTDGGIVREWWEKPADKRGLNAAKQWLKERRNQFDTNQNLCDHTAHRHLV